MNKIISGLSWSFGERILAQGVSFLVSIILARILSPNEFGLIAIIMVFINIANVFVSNGFGESLVQKKDSDKYDFTTIFWCGFTFSIVLMAIIWLLSPMISEFYHSDALIWPLRILSIKLVLASLNSIQHAYIEKHMMFKQMFFSTLIGTVFSAVVGIGLALKGAGIWALIFQYLSNSAIDTIALSFIINWKPFFYFSKERAKKLVSFSWKVTASALVNEVYAQLRLIIIGRRYSSADLAYYNKGNSFPQLIMTNVNVAVNKVFFPAMSNINDNIDYLKKVTRKAVTGTALVTFPFMIYLFVAADKIIPLLLTEKWMESVDYLRILCFLWMFQPVQSAHWQVIKAVGRSDICLKLEIMKKTIGIVLVISTMFISVRALAYSAVAFAVISMIINMVPSRNLIGYTFLEQIIDILPCIVASFVSAIFTSIISLNIKGYLFGAIVDAFVSFSLYGFVLMCLYFRTPKRAYSEMVEIIKKMKNRNDNNK